MGRCRAGQCPAYKTEEGPETAAEDAMGQEETEVGESRRVECTEGSVAVRGEVYSYVQCERKYRVT